MSKAELGTIASREDIEPRESDNDDNFPQDT